MRSHGEGTGGRGRTGSGSPLPADVQHDVDRVRERVDRQFPRPLWEVLAAELCRYDHPPVLAALSTGRITEQTRISITPRREAKR